MAIEPDEARLAYRLVLNREPGPAEIELVTGEDLTLTQLHRRFIDSVEFGRLYRRLKADLDAASPPTILHIHIPATGGRSVTAALDRDGARSPFVNLRDDQREMLRKMPAQKRRTLRYVCGHLSIGASDDLGVDHQIVCLLRRPGPRLFSLYNVIARNPAHPGFAAIDDHKLSFGEWLAYSVDTPALRAELDNGQIRRLSGDIDRPLIAGEEPANLRRALHHAMAPNMVLGLADHMPAFGRAMIARGLLKEPVGFHNNRSPQAGHYNHIIDTLTADERRVFDHYTAWDQYFYDLCELLMITDE